MLLSASTSQRLVTTGTGSPEAVLTRTVGSVYVQSDAADAAHLLWLKLTGTGNTGWSNLPVADVAQMLEELAGVRALAASRLPRLSPQMLGVPTAPTAIAGTNTTQVATTQFVTTAAAAASVADGDKGDVVVSSSGAVWTLDSAVVTAAARTVLDDASVGAMLATMGGAPLASPTFTGTPAAPTAIAGTNTTQVATTQFVTTAVAGASVSGDSDQIVLGSQIFGA